jgi:uncharacterized paraquat-inducible protein A
MYKSGNDSALYAMQKLESGRKAAGGRHEQSSHKVVALWLVVQYIVAVLGLPVLYIVVVLVPVLYIVAVLWLLVLYIHNEQSSTTS